MVPVKSFRTCLFDLNGDTDISYVITICSISIDYLLLQLKPKKQKPGTCQRDKKTGCSKNETVRSLGK